MSFSFEPPLTRRAAREAARATGEQPSWPAAVATEPGEHTEETTTSPQNAAPAAAFEAAEPAQAPAEPFVEPPTETGVIGPDGQILTRRRLREIREQEARTGVPVLAQPAPAPASPAAPAEHSAPSASPVAQETADATPVAIAPPPAAGDPEPRPEWTAPEGHWTRQLELEDDEEALETTYSREVGSANPTTSALIIPDVPVVMDLGGPLDATGEILLTGSIPLSPSLSTTGSIERLSDAEADRDDHFDDHRLHATAQDAQPVRAAAVASQHALGTPIVSDGKHRGGRGLTVLLVAASALAVVVTGLIITAIALKWI